MTSTTWPDGLPVQQVRVARPTDRLDAVVAFYRDALGLPELARFDGHVGYTGIMLGLPGTPYHLEFTTHSDGSPCPAPTRDNLLVLYVGTEQNKQAVLTRLAEHGHAEVAAENPFWSDHGGATVADPDGWRVVLMPEVGFTID